MATGYEKGGVDLDTLFMARVNTKAADTGYKVAGGNDLSDEFEPIGDGTKIADVGYDDGGVDISNIFRDINESLETITFPTSTLVVSTNGAGGIDTTGHRFNTDGSCDETNFNGTWVASDDWLNTSPSDPSDYEIKWNYTSGTYADNTYGTENTWLGLNSQRVMSFNAGGPGAKIMNYTVTVRKVGDASSEVTRTVQLDQQYEP